MVLPHSSSARSKRPVRSLAKLSRDDIDALTNVLSVPITNEDSPFELKWGHPASLQERRETVADLIQHLPARLLRPSSMNWVHVGTGKRWHDFIGGLFGLGKGHTRHPLCKTHRQLNPRLIHSVFTAHIAEIGPRLEPVITHYGDPSVEAHLTPALKERIVRQRAFQALWIPPAVYREWFSADPCSKWTFQADGCEACTLARISADLETVLDLRVAAASRWSRKRRRGYGEGRRAPPRVFRWTDALVGWSGGDDEVEERCDRDARMLRKARRAARRSLKGSDAHGERGEDDEDGADLDLDVSTNNPTASVSASDSNSTTSEAVPGAHQENKPLTYDCSGGDDDPNSDGDEGSLELSVMSYYTAMSSVATFHSRTSAPSTTNTPSPRFSSTTELIVDGLVHPAARATSSIYPSNQSSSYARRSTCDSGVGISLAADASLGQSGRHRHAASRAGEYRDLIGHVRHSCRGRGSEALELFGNAPVAVH